MRSISRRLLTKLSFSWNTNARQKVWVRSGRSAIRSYFSLWKLACLKCATATKLLAMKVELTSKGKAALLIINHLSKVVRSAFWKLRRETCVVKGSKSSEEFIENLRTIRLGHRQERRAMGARLLCFLFDELKVRRRVCWSFLLWKVARSS